MRKIRKVAAGEPNDFFIFSNESMLTEINKITDPIKLIALAISLIALIAAGVGIMNIKSETGSVTNANTNLVVVEPLVRKYWNIAGNFYFFGQLATPIITGKEKEADTKVTQFGVAIDMPAGPSELLIVADNTAVPAFVASDLLSQAEHGADSQVILVSTSQQIIDTVSVEIKKQITVLPRFEIAQKAIEKTTEFFQSAGMKTKLSENTENFQDTASFIVISL